MENVSTSQQSQSAEIRTASPVRPYIRPAAQIVETADGFLVQIEMPGVNRQGLEITFENGVLTVVGHRASVVAGSNGAALPESPHRESRPADYRRVFEVRSTVDPAHIGAKIEQGLLTLELPRADAAKPRRIEISGLN